MVQVPTRTDDERITIEAMALAIEAGHAPSPELMSCFASLQPHLDELTSAGATPKRVATAIHTWTKRFNQVGSGPRKPFADGMATLRIELSRQHRGNGNASHPAGGQSDRAGQPSMHSGRNDAPWAPIR